MSAAEVTKTPAVDVSIISVTDTFPLARLQGDVIAGFRVKHLLGRGGAGEVYLAEHPASRTRVAIKVLRPEIARNPVQLRRFELEVKAASEIRSSHVVPVLECGTLFDGRPFAIMEFLVGKSLRQVITEEAPMPLARAMEIILQIARGMLAAQQLDIIHRDLKPANIFLEDKAERPTSFVRILDFGIAKFSPAVQEHTLTHDTGAPLGTPRYASPEQLNGGKVTHTSDIYALGTIAYELFAGQTPYTGEPTSLINKKILQDPEPLNKVRPDLPRGICDFVMSMIARIPENRPGSFVEVVRFFATPQLWERRARFSRGKLVAAAACALLVLSLFISASVALPSPEPARQTRADLKGPQEFLSKPIFDATNLTLPSEILQQPTITPEASPAPEPVAKKNPPRATRTSPKIKSTVRAKAVAPKTKTPSRANYELANPFMEEE